MPRAIDGKLWERWRQRLQEFESSGLSVAAWCRREGVSTASFYQWKKKLKTARPNGRHRRAAAGARPRFVPVVAASSPVVLMLVNGVRIELPASDRSLIDQVIRTAAGVPTGEMP